jgi:hypothetical protein
MNNFGPGQSVLYAMNSVCVSNLVCYFLWRFSFQRKCLIVTIHLQDIIFCIYQSTERTLAIFFYCKKFSYSTKCVHSFSAFSKLSKQVHFSVSTFKSKTRYHGEQPQNYTLRKKNFEM